MAGMLSVAYSDTDACCEVMDAVFLLLASELTDVVDLQVAKSTASIMSEWVGG